MGAISNMPASSLVALKCPQSFFGTAKAHARFRWQGLVKLFQFLMAQVVREISLCHAQNMEWMGHGHLNPSMKLEIIILATKKKTSLLITFDHPPIWIYEPSSWPWHTYSTPKEMQMFISALREPNLFEEIPSPTRWRAVSVCTGIDILRGVVPCLRRRRNDALRPPCSWNPVVELRSSCPSQPQVSFSTTSAMCNECHRAGVPDLYLLLLSKSQGRTSGWEWIQCSMLGGKPASPNAPDIAIIALKNPTPFSFGKVVQHLALKQFWINQVWHITATGSPHIARCMWVRNWWHSHRTNIAAAWHISVVTARERPQ